MRVPRTAVLIQINKNLSPRLKDHQTIFPNYELHMNQYIRIYLTNLMSLYSRFLYQKGLRAKPEKFLKVMPFPASLPLQQSVIRVS
jgi:hypothetical protein